MGKMRVPKGANFNTFLILLVPSIALVVQFYFGGKTADEKDQVSSKRSGKLTAAVQLVDKKIDGTNTLIIALFADVKREIDTLGKKSEGLEKKIQIQTDKLNNLIQQQNENQGNLYPLRFDSVRSITPINLNSVTGYCAD